MKLDIRNALTSVDCTTALALASRLYNSSYVDNESRLLFASSHGCNIGINLYTLIDELSKTTFGDQNQIFKALVRLFPSTASDSRMESSWYAQDALLSSLMNGAVTSTVDQFNPALGSAGNGIDPTTNLPYNTASTLSRNRTADSNAYLVFIGMAAVGTALNRYGYAAGQSPAALSYGQGQDLTWTSRALMRGDSTGSGCALVSGLYNMLDGMEATSGLMSGSAGSSMTNIVGNLKDAINQGGTAACTQDCLLIDSLSAAVCAIECSAAEARLRYRGACTETTAAASFAAGVIQIINAGWL